ncbi:acyl-CoA dehydrogenase family protein [Gammaproteobacteria bacterium]|nr:acyl-CoA dehydrogenase family protein [Gammaproteobacteria bacterium]MDC0091852.1 acyl-CoA dehydrogenase family protein [Gammaproteobacteria bacterium]MDC1326009.1 acyl-CoA dehydrogenase family protein [Gammaproteobacteria bacterium]MDC1526217.1 acyl-CoA dehydrogenase family protein [Gammaproteobacteria bacterium]
MKLILSEEQQFLKDTALSFARDRTPVTHFRSLRDSNNVNCWDSGIWQEMVELGWSGILVPEEFGGSDFGIGGISVIMQELGKTLTPSPLLATAVLGVSVIKMLGSEDHKKIYLPKIVSGEITTAFAIDEGHHHNPFQIETSATLSDEHWVLNGQKVFVLDGASANTILIVARTSGKPGESNGLSVFVANKDSAGLEISQISTADCRNYANISMNNLKLSQEACLGAADMAGEIVEKVLDLARIAMAAEMLGNMEEAFEVTVNYLKERKQFGVAIGSFQALQHRAAKMFCEIELTKSAVMAAMHAADESSNDLERLSSLAKFQAGETLHLVSNESIQMHGGIGVTDEYDIGFYLKRARVAEQIFGTSEYHQARYADISGF